MLPDKFFLWPYSGDGLAEAIADLNPVFSKSKLLKGWLGNPFPGDLVEYLALACRNRNVNPWWLVVSGEREQSIFSREPVSSDVDLRAVEAWLGVVGQDVGRALLPGYYGIYTQVARFTEVTAWLMGIESALAAA